MRIPKLYFISIGPISFRMDAGIFPVDRWPVQHYVLSGQGVGVTPVQHYVIRRPVGGRRFRYGSIKDGGTVWGDNPWDVSPFTFDDNKAAGEFLVQNKKLFGPDDVMSPLAAFDGKHCQYCGQEEETLRHVATDRGVPRVTLEFSCSYCNITVEAGYRFEGVSRKG